MRTLDQMLDWEGRQIQHGPAQWRGLCLKHARSAWNLPPQAPSAKSFFEYVEANHPQHMHHSDYREVPAGAIVLDPNLSHWGHAWISGAKAGHGISSDYRRSGHLDYVPLHLPHWRHGDTTVFWTDWTHQGLLPVHPHHTREA